ncbi:PRD domain-containing protein [Niallia sp. NCCP-28]|uniref:PRD domain-containing protein n=1 Tax=Niallia sp. NCCP-28 TaxID=2934712 RepID=UPI002085F2D4|nr:PRD domain-containing protein [Niallia sp. NCCP-28]GKU83298.1 hypothetical protein NCCP28_26940 [Niallia sp. NCCP-28]
MKSISINSLDLKIASYLQEKNLLNLSESEQIFNRSINSLKRHIANINMYLPDDKQFVMDGSIIKSSLKYTDYIQFISNLSIQDYISSQEERISMIIVLSFLTKYLNTSKIYEDIGISLTTKKKDLKALSDYLTKNYLNLKTVPAKGIQIEGTECTFRILTASILVSLIEINEKEELINRKANNPIQKYLVDIFFEVVKPEIVHSKVLINDFYQKNHFRVSYTSKKFFYLYIILSLYRRNHKHFIEKNENIGLYVYKWNFFKHADEPENHFLDYIIASLDYNANAPYIMDEHLKRTTERFIKKIQKNIITNFYQYKPLFKEVYTYLYKCIIHSQYGFYFYDNKLEDTYKFLPKLFTIVSSAVKVIENDHNIKFNKSQISTLTLIFKKFIMENKVIGRNTKRIVIVTNSAIEKTDFFIENLRHHLDIEVIHTLNINELYLIEKLDYDTIITFSNRIATLLAEQKYSCVKLKFYFDQNDIDILLKAGFSTSSRRKIIADSFINEISNLNSDDIKKLLLDKYASHFL